MYRFIQQFFPISSILNFLMPEPETIPLSKLPYGFRIQIINNSSLSIINDLIKLISVFDNICLLPIDTHRQVFITDNPAICREASRDTFLFRFCKSLDKFKHWRKTKDGDSTIYPIWDSVLLVDEIVDRNKKIYVDDTLIMHCQIANFEKVIPYIFGPYSRLVLHGDCTWSQVKRLVQPGVKQVRLSGLVRLEPTELDDFVDFVMRHSRGVEYTFSFRSRNDNSHVVSRLNYACRFHNTHSAEHYDGMYHVMHKNKICDSLYSVLVLTVLSMLVSIVIPLIFLHIHRVVSMGYVYAKDKTDDAFFLNCFLSLILGGGFSMFVISDCPMDTIRENSASSNTDNSWLNIIRNLIWNIVCMIVSLYNKMLNHLKDIHLNS